MKKIIFILLFITASLFAQLTNQYLTKDFLNKNIPIVDIRTAPEWRETGILKRAIPITFFNQQGGMEYATKKLHLKTIPYRGK